MHYFTFTDPDVRDFWEEFYYFLDEVAFTDEEPKAASKIKRFVKKCTHPEKYLTLARFYEHVNEYKKAFGAVSDYIKAGSPSLGYYLRSDLYRDTDNPEPDQIADLTRAIDAADADFRSLYLHQTLLDRARLYKSLDQIDAAFADCDILLALPPRYDENFTMDQIHLMRASLFHASGRDDEAEASFDQAILSAPQGLNRHLPAIEKARFLSDIRRFDAAIAVYTHIIEDPELAEWEKNLHQTDIAECLIADKRIPEARSLLTEILSRDADFNPASDLLEKC
jgi:tetratricopeptide (TPR) repeat protein